MIPGVLVALCALAALAYVLVPLRKGPQQEEARSTQLIDEARERKQAALLAILDIEEERSIGKLSDADFEVLRSQYEVRALEALRQLDELGAEEAVVDDQLEAEIARIRADMTCPECGTIRRQGRPCPTCGRV